MGLQARRRFLQKLALTLNAAQDVCVYASDSLGRQIAGIGVIPWTVKKTDRRTEEEAVAIEMPVIRAGDFRRVQIVKAGEDGQVRFQMEDQEVLFDGHDFQVK